MDTSGRLIFGKLEEGLHSFLKTGFVLLVEESHASAEVIPGVGLVTSFCFEVSMSG